MAHPTVGRDPALRGDGDPFTRTERRNESSERPLNLIAVTATKEHDAPGRRGSRDIWDCGVLRCEDRMVDPEPGQHFQVREILDERALVVDEDERPALREAVGTLDDQLDVPEAARARCVSDREAARFGLREPSGAARDERQPCLEEPQRLHGAGQLIERRQDHLQ
ncbi:MAG TPA: hypothetical protein VLM85_03980 [Polyangiaceae bacterium]|nr:hypothetical protein [Polyangiaceae bacterium]